MKTYKINEQIYNRKYKLKLKDNEYSNYQCARYNITIPKIVLNDIDYKNEDKLKFKEVDKNTIIITKKKENKGENIMKITTETKINKIEKFIENYNEYVKKREECEGYPCYPINIEFSDDGITLREKNWYKEMSIDELYELTDLAPEEFYNWLSVIDFDIE